MKRSLILLILFITVGCIDIVRLKYDGGGVLVVDGLITNEAGPYTIYVSRSLDFDNNRPVSVFKNPETGAVISISDNTGFKETLVEYESGAYRTKNIQGIVGNTYQVSIKTTNGRNYISEPETMPEMVPLAKVDFTFDTYDSFFINSNSEPKPILAQGFFIYASFPDPPGHGNAYRWKTSGAHELFVQNDDPTKTHCWMEADHLETQIQVSDDLLFDGKTARQFVCMVPYDMPYKYLIRMSQQSLTERAYHYWDVSKQQQQNTGSIFDAPPAIIEGNIKNVADDNETVLGYFGASAYSRMNLMLDRLKAANFVGPIPVFKLDTGTCLITYAGASRYPPADWE